jgi:hypothetical protein
MTDLDGYWKTRTINEAQTQGYTFLRLTGGCGKIVDFPFTLLHQRRGVTRYTFLGNIPFRCQSCGSTESKIGVNSQTSALGHFKPNVPR